jgi:hypothetical protein
MAVALDGANNGGTVSSSIVLSLTTTGGSGVVIVCSMFETGTGGSGTPTATGLTFVTRQGPFTCTSGYLLNTWVAPYSSNFSGNITIPTSNASTHQLYATVFGVSGTGGTFDAGGVPVSNTGGTLNFSVTTAGDFIFVSGSDGAGDNTHTAAGWTRINNIVAVGIQDVFYKNLPASSGAVSFQMDAGSNINDGVTGDALTPGGGAGPTLTLMPATLRMM